MEALIIQGTEDTPEVYFDKEMGVFKISGNSFSDDPFESFSPMFKWMDEYMKDPNPETQLEVKMSYLNTASSKQLTEVLFKLRELANKAKVKVVWYYDKMDEDMEFEGETLKHIANLDFELIGY